MAPVLVSAIIWAAVIFAATFSVPDVFSMLLPILGGGAAAHIILLGAIYRKRKTS